jgi:hypothetical protein
MTSFVANEKVFDKSSYYTVRNREDTSITLALKSMNSFVLLYKGAVQETVRGTA